VEENRFRRGFLGQQQMENSFLGAKPLARGDFGKPAAVITRQPRFIQAEDPHAPRAAGKHVQVFPFVLVSRHLGHNASALLLIRQDLSGFLQAFASHPGRKHLKQIRHTRRVWVDARSDIGSTRLRERDLPQTAG